MKQLEPGIIAVPGTDAALDASQPVPTLLTEREFHALYARTAAPLRAYVIRILGSATNADDILQDTYLRLLRKPVPTRDADELRAYVFRIASNLVVDHWRARKREVPDTPPDRGASGRDQGLRLDITRLFAKLKPRERQLVWLAHVEGADHREIAAALGLRAGSVRVLLSRARQRFARLLRDHGHTPGEAR
ncbi:MAG TPA: RNA polymerase sigma factor [Vicinamibacterales bacterium]|nr:RNA polymerase sigma factor [Vicinamibacterales bacterium]